MKKSSNSFKRMVKVKTKEFTLNYLLGIKERHSKMDDLHYGELTLQNYLKDQDIPVVEARNLYRYRTRCAKYKENMKNSYITISTACPVPTVPGPARYSEAQFTVPCC